MVLTALWSSGQPNDLGDGREECAPLENPARNDLIHDLCGATTDREEARISTQSLHLRFAHVSHASEELNGVVTDVHGHFRREILRHCDLSHGALTASDSLAECVIQGLGGQYLSRHIGKLVAVDLEFPDRLSEGLALLAVGEGFFQGDLCRCVAVEGQGQSLGHKILHDRNEATAFITDAVRDGDAYVVEDQFCCVASPPPGLFQCSGGSESVHAAFDDKEGQAPMWIGSSPCENHNQVRADTACNEEF